jgi:hypothetical protein
LDKKQRQQLEEIVNGIKCPKNFRCYKSGLEYLCKAEDIGQESFLACKEKDGATCKFAVPLGKAYFCQCPIRIYIAKNLGK